MSSIVSRRVVLLASLGASVIGGGVARAQNASLFPLFGDDGKPVFNFRLPSEPSIVGLPGIVWTGAPTPETILVEFFDYNCPFCRAAAPDLTALVKSTATLRLGLVNDPILSAGSVEAAKVQQAVLRAAGPAQAYAFHGALLARKGPADGPAALAVARSLGLDARAIETAADLPQVGAVVGRQAQLAEGLGLTATPSFLLGNIGILGYPGPRAMAAALAASRRCDKLVC